MREVDRPYILVAFCNSQTQQELTTQRMCLSIELLFSENIQSFTEGILLFQDLRRNGSVIKTSWNLCLSSSRRPYKLNHFNYFLIESPSNISNIIKSLCNLREIILLIMLNRLIELRQQSRYFRLFQVVPSEYITFPGSWFIYHRQASFKL